MYLAETTGRPFAVRASLVICALSVQHFSSIGGFEPARVQWKLFCEGSNLFSNSLLDRRVAQVRKHFRDPSGNFFHFRLAHPACGDLRTAHANSAGLHG